MYLDVPIPEIALDTKDQIVVDVQPTIETKVDNSLTVEAIRKQYAIVGDALFAVQTTDEAPPWLTDILDSVVSDVLDPTKQDLDQANQNIIQALKDLDVARNQYEELINIEATIDTIIASRLATLNASMDLANANIIELQITKVTEDEAIAIAAQQVAASVGPLEENVNSSISIIQTSVAELNVSMDNQYAQLNDNMEELDLALTSQITQLEVNVGENMAKLIEDMTTYTDSSGRSLGKYSVALDLVGKDPEGRDSKLVGGFILAGDTAEGVIKAGFDVDTFYVGRQGSDGVRPFEVVGQKVFMREAMIQDASITTAKIGNAEITNAKIKDGSVDSAKVSSYLMSDNFNGSTTTPENDGTSGWIIRKDGTASFNDVYVRGVIEANKLIAGSVTTSSLNGITTKELVKTQDFVTYSGSNVDVVSDIELPADNSDKTGIAIISMYMDSRAQQPFPNTPLNGAQILLNGSVHLTIPSVLQIREIYHGIGGIAGYNTSATVTYSAILSFKHLDRLGIRLVRNREGDIRARYDILVLK